MSPYKVIISDENLWIYKLNKRSDFSYANDKYTREKIKC